MFYAVTCAIRFNAVRCAHTFHFESAHQGSALHLHTILLAYTHFCFLHCPPNKAASTPIYHPTYYALNKLSVSINNEAKMTRLCVCVWTSVPWIEKWVKVWKVTLIRERHFLYSPEWTHPSTHISSSASITCKPLSLLTSLSCGQLHVLSMMAYICIKSLLADWIGQRSLVVDRHTFRRDNNNQGINGMYDDRQDDSFLLNVRYVCVCMCVRVCEFPLCVS